MPLSKSYALLRNAVLLFAASLLSACQAFPTANDHLREDILRVADGYFGERLLIPESHEFHELSADSEAEFLRYFNDPVRARTPRFRRVANYVASIITDFEYRSDTYNAADTLSSKSGNCLSLAMMTTALAQLAGVEVAYQLMNSDPVFNFHGTTVEKGVHVRALLLNGEKELKQGTSETVWGIAMDFFPTERDRFVRNMQNGEYEAMYYRNIAVEALRRNDLPTAYWYARESLRYNSESSEALNTLAIVSRRAGHSATAEVIYLYALEHADEKLTLLKNYRVLLVMGGRQQEAEQIDAQLKYMADPSPNNWFQLARSAYEEHDYRRAVDYYQRVLKLAPYLNDARLELAKSYLELGDNDKAMESLLTAIEGAGNLQDRRYYKSKLTSFKHRDS